MQHLRAHLSPPALNDGFAQYAPAGSRADELEGTEKISSERTETASFRRTYSHLLVHWYFLLLLLLLDSKYRIMLISDGTKIK